MREAESILHHFEMSETIHRLTERHFAVSLQFPNFGTTASRQNEARKLANQFEVLQVVSASAQLGLDAIFLKKIAPTRDEYLSITMISI